MGHVRILLADDHKGILETVMRLLAVDFDVVGAVENGEQAVRAVAELDPDVVVLDITMPVMNGIEVASCLKESGSRARVVFLTVHTGPAFLDAAFSAGALGYALKPHLNTDLVPAIREALEGRMFTSRCLGIGATAGIRSGAKAQ